MDRADWKAAHAMLAAIIEEREEMIAPMRHAYEAARAKILAPTTERYEQAVEHMERVQDETGEPIGFCEGCSEPLFDGDKHHLGADFDYFCEPCAPSYGDMLSSCVHFRGGDDDQPMTQDEAKVIVDAHLADGGSLDDKLVQQ